MENNEIICKDEGSTCSDSEKCKVSVLEVHMLNSRKYTKP
jgi:hypothetical protein